MEFYSKEHLLFQKNIRDSHSRVNYINSYFNTKPKFVMILHPEYSKWVEERRSWNAGYKMILKEYFENQLNMAKDIHETTYYNQLNSQEKEDFLEEHREFGNEILGLE